MNAPCSIGSVTSEYFFGQCDASVLAAGTSDADGEVSFSFALISGDEEIDEGTCLGEKGFSIGIGEDVIGDGFVESGEFGEFGDEVRILEETDVEDEIGIEQNAVFVSKADDCRSHVRGIVAVPRPYESTKLMW